MKQGIVYIAGAGPGDPELLTLKVISRIREADVILYDHLIGKEVLMVARPGAELIYAGKKAGEDYISQSEINSLLIEKARAGLTVLRLKGGDPFLFGRGGEEAVALAEAGIRFEIVPGVSSINAVPLYAGIPLTHRGLSSCIAVLTGHRRSDEGCEELCWDAIARLDTIVVLMGVGLIREIAARLLKNGRDPEDPVAVIRWGTTPLQVTWTGTLRSIVEGKEKLPNPPALTVIGKVIGLRGILNWFERQPLFGRKVLITRAAGGGPFLRRALEKLGALVIEQPSMRITQPDDGSAADRAILDLSSYDAVVFPSTNSVRWFIRRLWAAGKDMRWTSSILLLATGRQAAGTLEEMNIRTDAVLGPAYGKNFAALFGGDASGRRVLVPAPAEAEIRVSGELESIGARVDTVPFYRTVPAELQDDLRPYLSDVVDLVIFTSSSAVRNFYTLFGRDATRLLERADIACLGPFTAAAAARQGLTVTIQPARYNLKDLVEAIRDRYGGSES
jgi:uroporphyrinogen III methyltransferase/synthase